MEDRSKRKMCETLSRNPILKTWMSSRTTQTQCASNPNTNTHNSSEREREREQIYTQPEIARSFVYFLEREGERKEEKKKRRRSFRLPPLFTSHNSQTRILSDGPYDNAFLCVHFNLTVGDVFPLAL